MNQRNEPNKKVGIKTKEMQDSMGDKQRNEANAKRQCSLMFS